MKKLIAMLLCLSMLFCAAAVAETAEKTQLGQIDVNGAFKLQGTLPEGYSYETVDLENGNFCAVIRYLDYTKPVMSLSVAYNELAADVERLNDVDDETLARLENTFRTEDDVEISYRETAYGTKLMMVKEVLDGVDYVDFYTLYKGYEVEFVLLPAVDAGDGTLSEQEIQTAIDFLSDLEFVPAE